METEVISTEIIKPSSPTPKSLQKHQLSSFDQYIPPVFIGHVYFYTSNPKISCSRKSNHLKKSLSETLSRFYPLVGRLVDNLYVDCNDRGALFAEAEASCDLSQFLASRDLKEMNQFLPHKLNESQSFCLAVQATYFRCGGLAVGLLISHKIADGSSSILFFNSWSAISRNGDAGGLPVPKFDAAAYFPPGDMPSASLMVKEENSRKIFTFPAAEIAILRRRYSTAAFRPSRVEAVSAFIWTRFISACMGKKIDPNKTLTVNYLVNLRPRVEPPMSESHFGNIFTRAIAKLDVDDGGAELVMKIREAMKCVEKESDLVLEMRARAMKGELISFTFTSLCGFPLYEADFGWGKPAWVGLEGSTYMNLAVFSETESGGGIEALVHLSKQDMKKFEAGLEGYAIKSKL